MNEITSLAQRKYLNITSLAILARDSNKELELLKTDEENKELLYCLESQKELLIRNLEIKKNI